MPPRPKPASYQHLEITLRLALEWSTLLYLHQELCGAPLPPFTPAGLGQAFRELTQKLELEWFPIYCFSEEVAYDIEEGHRDLADGLPPLHDLVVFQGLDVERLWDDWDPVSQLILALIWHEETNLAYPEIWSWWAKLASQYDLPPLARIDPNAVIANVENLPEPWNGLYATYCWFEGNNNNIFVDVPAIYAHEMAWAELDWTMEDLQYLRDDYQWADREIFTPALQLDRLVSQNPTAFATCIDLCLGRLSWISQDGELIILEQELATA